jgi:hypothetical protein
VGHEALALFFTLITVAITIAFASWAELRNVRAELHRVRKGLANLTNVNTRTNLYAQTAIAAHARQAGVLNEPGVATEDLHAKRERS